MYLSSPHPGPRSAGEGASSLRPLRSWLYAPGNNPKLLRRVFEAGADAVILDLEDAVPPAEKARAREMVAETVRSRHGQVGPALFVRINHPSTGLAEEDVAAVVGLGLDGVRIPKVESPETVEQVAGWVRQAEAGAGLPAGAVALVCNVESAVGVWHALEIAERRPLALAFGAVDFIRDINGEPGMKGLETLYARSRLVLASRVARIRAPVESVYPRIQDDEGLERSTRLSRGLGFFGRSAIHPRQVPIINHLFTPTAEQIARAREIVDGAAKAEATGSGALQLAGGEFVDRPVVDRSEALLQLADALGSRDA